MLSSKADMREYAAELYALVAVYGADVSTLNDVIKQLMDGLKSTDNQVPAARFPNTLIE